MTEQLMLADMPAQLFACTPSRLASFDCPRRYRFSYVDRPPPLRGAPWAHSVVGAVAHVALARWFGLPRPHRTPEHGADLVHENWQNLGFRDDEQSASTAVTTAAWVERYLGDVDPWVEPVGVERTVATRTERLAVSGRVDRIDDRGEELVIVDYKTGRRPPDEYEARASQALALYAVAAARTLRMPCTTVELHHLPTGTIAAAEHTPESLRRHLQRAEETAGDLRLATDTLDAGGDGDVLFPPRPDRRCAWCDFRPSCAAGQEAAPAAQPWDLLAP